MVDLAVTLILLYVIMYQYVYFDKLQCLIA